MDIEQLMAEIKDFLTSFKPSSISERLDIISVSFLAGDLSSDTISDALKLASSRIIPIINENIWEQFSHHFSKKENLMFNTLSTLPSGMEQATRKSFRTVIKQAMDDNGLLDSMKLRVSITKRKLEILQSGISNNEELQMLNILDYLAIDICTSDNNNSDVTSATEETETDAEATITTTRTISEETYYRRQAHIFDILLRGTSLRLTDGEQISYVSKKYQKKNLQYFDVNKEFTTFGHRIDLLMGTMGVELGVSEWKKAGAGKKAVTKQQVKTMLINKAILAEISTLPLSAEYAPSVIAMDWVGSEGFMFLVRKIDEVYIINHICDLKILGKITEIEVFESTLNGLIIWRNHHVTLHKMVKLAISTKRQQLQCSTSVSSSGKNRQHISDHTYIVPSKKCRAK
jgi:hypothetical protein